MNLLREVRRVQKKSMATRIRLLFTFSLMLIVTTYAWRSTQKDVKTNGLNANVTEWDVSYYVNEDENQILDQTATFTIDELYPGMPERIDVVHIYNLGTASTNIKYEVVSVKVFGQEILATNAEGKQVLKAYTEDNDGNMVETGETEIKLDGNTTHIFSEDTNYPFDISFTYDRNKLIGQYEDDETTPNAHAKCTFNLNWEYQVDGTAEEIEARDVLDTTFGKGAYKYYNANNDSQKAIEIQVKITSSMLHPDDDPDYVEPAN